MVREKFGIALMMVAALLVSGCASMTQYGMLHQQAQANYVSGNLDQAVAEAAQSLRINPKYDPPKLLLSTAFPNAVDAHLERIENVKRGSDSFKWDHVVAAYESIMLLNKHIKSLPPLLYKKQPVVFDIRDFSAELEEARNQAAEAHYQDGRRVFGKEGISNRDAAAAQFSASMKYVANYKDAAELAAEGYYQEGLRLSQVDDVETQKQAAKAFTAAQGYVRGYKDASDLYAIARKSGIKRMAIIPFEDKSGKGLQYGSVADAIVDGLVSDVMGDQGATEFLEIISRDQLSQVVSEQKLAMSGLVDVGTAAEVGGILGVHEILTGQITQISITPENTVVRSIQEKGSVVVGTEKYTDKDGKLRERDVWRDAHVTVTFYKRTAGASISGSYKIVDVKTAKLKDTKQFRCDYKFDCEWATFSGDARVLSQESKMMINKEERKAPVAEEMVSLAMRDFVKSLSKTLKTYAR